MTAHFVEKRPPPFWLAALALSCATSKSSESQLQLSGKEETAKTFEASAVIQEDTGGWTRKTWEFAPNAGSHRAGGGQVLPASPAPDLPASPAAAGDLSDHGPLLKYTEEAHTPSAKKTAIGVQGASETRVEVKANAEAHSASSTRLGLSMWAYALIAGVLAALAAAAFFKPPILLKLLARIFP